METKYKTQTEKEAYADGWNGGYEEGYDEASRDSGCWYELDRYEEPIFIGNCIRPVGADFRTSYRVVGLGNGQVFALFFSNEVGTFNAEEVELVK